MQRLQAMKMSSVAHLRQNASSAAGQGEKISEDEEHSDEEMEQEEYVDIENSEDEEEEEMKVDQKIEDHVTQTTNQNKDHEEKSPEK